MIEKFQEVIKQRDVVIPSLLFYNYRKLNMSAEEMVVLSHLLNEQSLFNPKKISLELSIPLGELMDIISQLKEKDIVKIELKKVGNVRAEVINLEGYYNKIIGILMGTGSEEKKDTIFDVFESSFGRTLSPMEYEVINAWKDNNFKEETILLALNEAIYNGVTNLRYIDRILVEWNKKGIVTKEDLEKNKTRYREQKVQAQDNTDYDWLNDDE